MCKLANKTLIYLLACTAILSSPASWAHKPPPRYDFWQVPPRHGVHFQQVSFEFHGIQYRETDWGQAAINPRRLRRGYLNVLVCEGGESGTVPSGRNCHWSIRNLYIPPKWRTNTAAFDRERLDDLLQSARREGDLERGALSPLGLLVTEIPQTYPLTYPFDLFPGSTRQEREERIANASSSTPVDSTVDELQAIVVLCSTMVPNREFLETLIRERGFSLTRYRVGRNFQNPQGGEGGEDTVDPVATSSVVPASATAPGYLGAIGFPPWGAPGLYPPPDPIPPSLPDTLVTAEEFYQDASFNIQSARNQCAEAADANAYRYLTSITPSWSMVFPFMPGFAKDPDLNDFDAQTGEYTEKSSYAIYGPILSLFGSQCGNCTATGVLDAFARREDVVSAETAPTGTTRCEHYRALFGYLSNLGDIADHTSFVHAGSDKYYGHNNRCDDPEYPTVIQAGQISRPFPLPDGPTVGNKPRVTWQWLYDRLKQKRALICTIGRYDSMNPDTRSRTSGHLVRVYGARKITADGFSQHWIYTMDDENQGANTSGLRTSAWQLEDLNADFRLNVNGANTELEYCIAIKAEPVPLNNPF